MYFEQLLKDKCLRKAEKYFISLNRDDVSKLPASFFSALEYYSSKIHSFVNIQAIIIASIIGLIGVAIGTIISN